MKRLLAFVRWSRDAGWSDTVWVLTYRMRTWRCVLFGHRWGDEQQDYEDAGYPIHVRTWRSCGRRPCEAYEEPWNIWRDREDEA